MLGLPRPKARVTTFAAMGGLLGVVALAGAASADQIANTIDDTVDATAEVLALNAGVTGTTQLYVHRTNLDGKNGCDLTGQSVLTLDLTSSDPAVVAVSPATVTFDSCGATKTVTVTALKAGSASITAVETANSTRGTWDLAPAAFTVNVSAPAPANTAPAVAVSGVAGGAVYPFGSVPQALCDVTDAEDGASSFPASLSAVTGPYAVDGIGDQTASCSYTDAGGLTASSSVTYGITDTSAPSVTSVLDPATPNGSNGWWVTDVSLDWLVNEPQSPSSLVLTGCQHQVISADQGPTGYDCSATSVGGTTTADTVTIKRDATAPSVGYTSVTGTEGTNGWYTSPVTATFTATDATSGPALANASSSSGATDEGPAVVVQSPAFSDVAGNTAAAGTSTHTFPIDLSDPTATFTGTIGSVYYGFVPPAPRCSATDSVSGPAGCTVTGYSTAPGTHRLTATAVDNAGRTGTAYQDYTVLSWTAKGFYQPIDMGGVYNTVKNGSTVPAKFELFAGPTELTDPSLVAMSTKRITCDTGAVTDAVETVATGNTSLRYDATAGQFVFNWKTPATPGACYALTMTAQDGSTLTANFKLK